MIQLNEDIEILIEEVGNKDDSQISASEQTVFDVVEAANLIEEDGLHAFWYSSLNTERVIRGFDSIGAFEVVDLIQSSQWCTSSSDDRSAFTYTEENHLTEIESELLPKFEELVDFIEEYLEDQES